MVTSDFVSLLSSSPFRDTRRYTPSIEDDGAGPVLSRRIYDKAHVSEAPTLPSIIAPATGFSAASALLISSDDVEDVDVVEPVAKKRKIESSKENHEQFDSGRPVSQNFWQDVERLSTPHKPSRPEDDLANCKMIRSASRLVMGNVTKPSVKTPSSSPPKFTKPTTFSPSSQIENADTTYAGMQVRGDSNHDQDKRVPGTAGATICNGSVSLEEHEQSCVGRSRLQDHTRDNDSAEEPILLLASAGPIQKVKKKAGKRTTKSSRTITSIAIAHANPRAIDHDGLTVRKLIGSSSKSAVADCSKDDGEAAKNEVEKPVKKKRASRAKKPKPSLPTPLKLASPFEAARNLETQDLLFGTSSQLASGESPQQIKSLQQALQESEKAMAQSSRTSAAFRRTGTDSLTTVREGLWSAAARNEESRLVDIEPFPQLPGQSCSYDCDDVDDVTIEPKLQRAGGYSTDPQTRPAGCESPTPIRNSATESTIMDESFKKRIKLPEFAVRRPTLLSVSHFAPLPAQRAPLTTLPTNANPKKKGSKKRDKNAEGYSGNGKETSDLDASVFKSRLPAVKQVPPKGSTSETKRASEKRTEQTEGKVKKPRGRPRKASVTVLHHDSELLEKIATYGQTTLADEEGFIDIEDIEDSDPEASPHSSPKPDLPSVVAALDLSASVQAPANVTDIVVAPAKAARKSRKESSDTLDKTEPAKRGRKARKQKSHEELQQEWTDRKLREAEKARAAAAQQDRLNPFITKAIRSQPRGQSHEHPSWHEKILLYDPIVIEHLHEWLNDGALEAAGWDVKEHRLETAQVQRWCESSSICCIWKEGLRGGVRFAY